MQCGLLAIADGNVVAIPSVARYTLLSLRHGRHFCCQIVQLAERLSLEQEVLGSNPSLAAIQTKTVGALQKEYRPFCVYISSNLRQNTLGFPKLKR